VHFANAMGDPRVIEDALGRRRLSGVDVRHDSDIPATVERYLSRHDILSLLLAGFVSPRFILFPFAGSGLEFYTLNPIPYTLGYQR
jgi:hypothetical protein